MIQNERMKIRVKFSKTGSVKFLGHLDVMRYFQKAVRRAGLPVAYTEGYHPHQIMSFAAPLSVGTESVGEYFDMELAEPVDAFREGDVSEKVLCENGKDASLPFASLTSAKIKALFNAQMADGFRVLSVVWLPETQGRKLSAMASVAAARYRLLFDDADERFYFALKQAAEALFAMEHIPLRKETKKGETEYDLKPSLYECVVGRGGAAFHTDENAEKKIADTDKVPMTDTDKVPMTDTDNAPMTDMEKDTGLAMAAGRKKAAGTNTGIHMNEDAYENLVYLELLVNASGSGTGNVKPTVVAEEILSRGGLLPLQSSYRIVRLETYLEEAGRFLPLEAAGHVFP